MIVVVLIAQLVRARQIIVQHAPIPNINTITTVSVSAQMVLH